MGEVPLYQHVMSHQPGYVISERDLFSSLLLSCLELSDTQVYEPQIRNAGMPEKTINFGC